MQVKSHASHNGLVHDIYSDNIMISNILHEAVLFDTSYEDVPADKKKGGSLPVSGINTPNFRQFYLKILPAKKAKYYVLPRATRNVDAQSLL